jgi:2-polyprenyl-3-methyl-5-hydroxy-6-metoxy-1,4-benzoquinol methylase
LPGLRRAVRASSGHPQLTRKVSADDTRVQVGLQMRFLRHFLRPGITSLEIGAGDCSLSAEVARTARHVYALDVSESISSLAERPANLEIVISDGVSVPVPPVQWTSRTATS